MIEVCNFAQLIFRGIVKCTLFSMIGLLIAIPSSFATIMTNNQKPIVLRKSDQRFQILIKSNPTTGYIWLLDQFDISSIKPIKHIYHAPQIKKTGQQPRIGAPGYDEWIFTLNKSAMRVPRLTRLTFCMMRPWTINCDIKKTFTVIYQYEQFIK